MSTVRVAPRAGLIGPTGGTGATGPAGTGATYIYRQRTTDFTPAQLSYVSDPVLTVLSVPVGTYLVSGVVRLSNPNASGAGALYILSAALPTGTQYGNTTITIDGASLDYGYSGAFDGSGSQPYTTIPINTFGACTISVNLSVTTAGAFTLRHLIGNQVALTIRAGSWMLLEKIA